MAEKIIYPLAYELKDDLRETLYYLGFPQRWKQELLEIDRSLKAKVNDEFGLPTYLLKQLVLSWMDGVVDMGVLKKYSDDSHWLTSCSCYSDQALKQLCQLIRLWCRVTYLSGKKQRTVSPLLREKIERFCASLDWAELKKLQSSESVQLTLENGTVSSEAYTALPLIAVNQLLGQKIQLQGKTLELSYAGKNELISEPIEYLKSRHLYSFVFDFSLQTTPPERHTLLLCHMSIRRWIHSPWKTEEAPYPEDSIMAHVRTGKNKFCQVELSASYADKRIFWDEKAAQCYEICGFNSLPEAEKILRTPMEFAPEILLPYKNGMKGFNQSKIGTGVPVQDKAALHAEILHLLDRIVKPGIPAAEWMGNKVLIPTLSSPGEYADTEAFRKWVKSCTGETALCFELYGLWQDPRQKDLLSKIRQKITDDFGANSADSCMQIDIVEKDVCDLVNGLENSSRQAQIRHSKQVEHFLGQAQMPTGSIVLIPDREAYKKSRTGDPKQAVRNGFALSGRVVQFINPEDSPEDIMEIGNTSDESTKEFSPKVIHCVYDLYRQMGITTLIDFEKKKHPMLSVPCIGLHICTQIHGKNKNGRFLPIIVQTDLQTGRTTVSCELFSRPELPYREACLEMAGLFRKDALDALCTQACRQPAKQLLLQLKNIYRTPDERVLLLVSSDGTTRPLWSGISDKEISTYALAQAYVPQSINSGKKNTPAVLPLLGSGVRIVRFRCNQEVPDYYTDLSTKAGGGQRAATSGIFKYGKTFWSIVSRPNDPKFKNSFRESRLDHPAKNYAEKDMIELYPIQLQQGDQEKDWIFFADALRALPLQYECTTVLPLPLHLAKGLEEYLFDI